MSDHAPASGKIMRHPGARPRHRRAGRVAGAARHRRQRRAAGDHRAFRAGAGRRAVARDLLRAGLRLADAGVRQAGRPVRPPPDLPPRPAALRRSAARPAPWRPSWPLFLWARAGQGIGTALALSCAPALATSLFAEIERTKGLAGFAAGQALASTHRAAARRAAGAAHRLVGGLLDARADRAGRARGVGVLPAPKPDRRASTPWARCCSPSA